MNSNHITISQILGAFGKHKFKCLITFLTVLTLVAIGFLMWPRNYGSEGKLYVQLSGRNSTSINPASGSESVSIQDSRETEVRSVVEFIKSRAVLESVVDEIGHEEILKSPWDNLIPEIKFPEFGSSSESEDGMSKEEYKLQKLRDMAAKRLEKNMTVVSEKKTSVISVHVKARSARLAQKLVDAVMQHTSDKYTEVQNIEGSTRYYDVEFLEQTKRLETAQAALRDFRNERKLLSVDGERGTLQGVLTRLENERLTSEIALASSTKRVEKLQAEMGTVDRLIDMPHTGVEQESFANSRTELFKLEAELAKAVADYRPNHPKIAMLKDQVNVLRQSLGGIRNQGTEMVSESNPIFSEVSVMLVAAEGEMYAAMATLEDVREKIESARKTLVQLNDDELLADKLQRAVGVEQDYLSIYQHKRGESKALDGYDVCALKVFQPGNLIVKHISPKGSLIAPMGIALALLCAMATALYCDRNHLSSLLGEDEVEQILEMPVLVTLPRVYSSRNMVN